MISGDDDGHDGRSGAAPEQYAQMAEGLYQRFRTISMSLDRRESFVWNLDGPEDGRDRSANAGPRRDDE